MPAYLYITEGSAHPSAYLFVESNVIVGGSQATIQSATSLVMGVHLFISTQVLELQVVYNFNLYNLPVSISTSYTLSS